jgi:hypothetical protein
MAAAADSIDVHLPNAVFDATESILYASYSFGTAEERCGRLIAQGSDGSIKPSESFLAGSQDLDGASNDSD